MAPKLVVAVFHLPSTTNFVLGAVTEGSKFVKKAHDGYMLDPALLSDHGYAQERLNVNSMQDGNHGDGLRGVLTCSRPREHVIELFFWNRRRR